MGYNINTFLVHNLVYYFKRVKQYCHVYVQREVIQIRNVELFILIFYCGSYDLNIAL